MVELGWMTSGRTRKIRELHWPGLKLPNAVGYRALSLKDLLQLRSEKLGEICEPNKNRT